MDEIQAIRAAKTLKKILNMHNIDYFFADAIDVLIKDSERMNLIDHAMINSDPGMGIYFKNKSIGCNSLRE